MSTTANETTLLSSEQYSVMLNALFGHSTTALAFIDINNAKTLWASPATRKIFSSSQDSILGQIDKEVIRSPARIKKWVDQIKSEGPIINKDMIFITEANSHFVSLTDVSFSNFHDINCLLFSFTDITYQKQLEAEMCHDSEADKFLGIISGKLLGLDISSAISNAIENLAAFLNLDRVSIQPVGVDNQKEQTYSWPNSIENTHMGICNIPIETQPWLEGQLFTGKTVSINDRELLPPESADLKNLLQTYKTKSALISPIRINRILIGFISIEMINLPRTWTSRETDLVKHLTNLIGASIGRDRAERKMSASTRHAEKSIADLENAQIKLIEAEKMATLGDLVAGITHEANTPLGVAVTTGSALSVRLRKLFRDYSEGKLKKSTLESYFKFATEGFGILEENLRRAADIIHNFKQVAVDVSSSSIQDINVDDYLQKILLSLQPRIKKFREIKIITSSSGNMDILTEPGALSQIITNLTMNALIHAFNNDLKASGTISIHTERINTSIRITFSDDGRGMSDEIFSQLFEPYFTTKRSEGSSGLGMLIIQGLVTKTLQGKLHAESTEGDGSIFTIDIPSSLTVTAIS